MPVALLSRKVELTLPKNEAVGFDIRQGKLTPPFGQGEIADMTFRYWSDYRYENRHAITNRLDIETRDGDGFITLAQEKWSALKTIRMAPEDGYTPLSFELSRTNDRILKDSSLKPDEYLVFRLSRESPDSSDCVYGKIDFFEYGECYPHTNDCMVIIRYSLNPTPNDRNLECAEQY